MRATAWMAIAALGPVVGAGSACRGHARRPAPAAVEARIRDADLGFFLARAERDPRGALDLARAAALLAERGRNTGRTAELDSAETLVRLSLANARRPEALRVLAGILLAGHRFTEALEVADALVAADPEGVADRALAAEIRMELGRYDEARAAFAALEPFEGDPAIAVRLARWADLTGFPERAGALHAAARRRAEHRWGVPAGHRAWYALQEGMHSLRYGRHAEARRALEAGLALAPTDPRLLEALARVARAEGRWREVRRLAGLARAGGAVDPGLLLLLADAADGLGRPAEARRLARRAERAALATPGPIHRDVALALLDRGRAVPAILARAEAELAVRRDVYGWDLQAWALHAAGRTAEAALAMRRALALGSRDPLLLRHARAIGGGA